MTIDLLRLPEDRDPLVHNHSVKRYDDLLPSRNTVLKNRPFLLWFRRRCFLLYPASPHFRAQDTAVSLASVSCGVDKGCDVSLVNGDADGGAADTGELSCFRDGHELIIENTALRFYEEPAYRMYPEFIGNMASPSTGIGKGKELVQ